MKDKLVINSPIGEMTVDKQWIKQELNKNNKKSLIGNTYFITHNNLTWSISKSDLDNIILEIRNDKINKVLNK